MGKVTSIDWMAFENYIYMKRIEIPKEIPKVIPKLITKQILLKSSTKIISSSPKKTYKIPIIRLTYDPIIECDQPLIGNFITLKDGIGTIAKSRSEIIGVGIFTQGAISNTRHSYIHPLMTELSKRQIIVTDELKSFILENDSEDLPKKISQKLDIKEFDIIPIDVIEPTLDTRQIVSVKSYGPVYVKDDGNCDIDKKCSCDCGIAVLGKDWFVMERISKNIIKIFFII